MKITIDIPDAKASKLIDAFCEHWKYQAVLEEPQPEGPPLQIPNPVTKKQFAENVCKGFFKESAKAGIVQLAVQKAQVDATVQATADMVF